MRKNGIEKNISTSYLLRKCVSESKQNVFEFKSSVVAAQWLKLLTVHIKVVWHIQVSSALFPNFRCNTWPIMDVKWMRVNHSRQNSSNSWSKSLWWHPVYEFSTQLTSVIKCLCINWLIDWNGLGDSGWNAKISPWKLITNSILMKCLASGLSINQDVAWKFKWLLKC